MHDLSHKERDMFNCEVEKLDVNYFFIEDRKKEERCSKDGVVRNSF